MTGGARTAGRPGPGEPLGYGSFATFQLPLVKSQTVTTSDFRPRGSRAILTGLSSAFGLVTTADADAGATGWDLPARVFRGFASAVRQRNKAALPNRRDRPWFRVRHHIHFVCQKRRLPR